MCAPLAILSTAYSTGTGADKTRAVCAVGHGHTFVGTFALTSIAFKSAFMVNSPVPPRDHSRVHGHIV